MMTVVINGTTGIDTGTGSLIAADATTPTYLDLFEDTDNGSNYVRLIAPTSIAANRTITLPDGTGTVVVNNVSSALVVGTAKVAVTDFTTAADFTGIPPWAKRVTLMWSGLSVSGTDSFLVQIGDSGGFATTLYNGGGSRMGGGSIASAGYTTGFGFANVTAAQLFSGFITIVNVTGNVWSATGMQGTDATEQNSITAGTRTLSGALTQVRMTRTGTNTFDAGTINVMWE
jgi:hypothetical protein